MSLLIKRWARRSKSAIIAFKIWQNRNMRRLYASGSIETQHGSSLRRKTLQESIDYVDEQFKDYLRYGNLSVEDLRGKTILELGFGDNVGVALRFIAAGAARVVCVDKFYSERDLSRERELYIALRGTMSPTERHEFDDVVEIDDGVKFNEARIKLMNGVDLTRDHESLFPNQLFDIIVSRAVIEEIFEPKKLFDVLEKLLTPNGVMLHKIDMTDYGMFSEGGMHPLTFLTIPNFIYRLMATDSGIPNRMLIGDYKRLLNSIGCETTFLVTSVVGCGPLVPHKALEDVDSNCVQSAELKINEIRARLSAPYRDLPNDELMISGVFLITRKQVPDQAIPGAAN